MSLFHSIWLGAHSFCWFCHVAAHLLMSNEFIPFYMAIEPMGFSINSLIANEPVSFSAGLVFPSTLC